MSASIAQCSGSNSIPISDSMDQAIQQKRINLQKKVDERFKGVNLLKEATYITSDAGTAGFSVVQGISLITSPSQGLVLFGAISGLVGGVLNLAQGLFLLSEALQALRNGQKEQFLRVLLDALSLIAIGMIMTLASLTALGVNLGILGGIAAIVANPYTMPIFILILVLPGLIQTCKHLYSISQGTDIASQLKLKEPDPEHLRQFAHNLFSNCTNAFERTSALIEQYSEQMGVEAGIELVELLKQASKQPKPEEIPQGREDETILKKQREELLAQIQLCQKKTAAWNRAVALRTVQLSCYGLTFPFGLAAGVVAGQAAKVISAVSKFFLTVPSSIGCYLDTFEPFKRNGTLGVPKAELNVNHSRL